jgi:hypothetical protein
LSLNVPDEGYSRTYPMKDIPECTWWRKFQGISAAYTDLPITTCVG